MRSDETAILIIAETGPEQCPLGHTTNGVLREFRFR